MDGRFNTIAGWVLGAGIVLLGANLVTDEIFKAERPETMGYPIAGVEEEGEGGAEAEQPIAHYLQTADAARGEAVFRKCARLPQCRPGRRQRPRPEPVRHDGRQRRPCRRLRLFRRAPLARRHLGLGDDERLAALARAPSRRARR